MKPSGQLNHSGISETDLEFAMETQSGFLIVVKGSGNDGRVTLAVRRRTGTPPASSIALAPDEVKRLVNLLAELSPSALKDKLVVGRGRDSYLDDLLGGHNEAADPEFELFMERDFPDLAKRKRQSPRSFLGAQASGPLQTITDFFANLPRPNRQVTIMGAILAVVAVAALSTVALLNTRPFSAPVKASAPPVDAASTANIDEFSRTFVVDMLTFQKDNYRRAQVAAMAKMSPELSQKYWQETGFPLSKAKLKAIPQDQLVQIAQVTTVPLSAGNYQVDVTGAVTSLTNGTNLPLHIQLTVNKDSQNKLTVTDQKDLSSAAK